MTDQMKRSLGLKVKAARRRARLTQEGLAAQISRTPESVSNIERGLQLPTLETLSDLGRVLGMPIAEFLDEAEDQRAVSRERRELEARMRELVRGLSDRDLAIAVEQVAVLTRRI